MLRRLKIPKSGTKDQMIFRSLKIFQNLKRFISMVKSSKMLRVGMRENSLEDKEIDQLIVYDTSGYFQIKIISIIMKKV